MLSLVVRKITARLQKVKGIVCRMRLGTCELSPRIVVVAVHPCGEGSWNMSSCLFGSPGRETNKLDEKK
jgi:hypothetical protein